jgi:serine/threonine protein kinase
MNLTAGAVLQSGKYIIQSVFSQSELGVTYQATHSGLDQTVTLQTLREGGSVEELAQRSQQFLTAARQFARCQHPHLVRLLDIFEEDTLPFAVLEHLPGQPLSERVQASQPLSEAAATHYIRQIASALQVLHRQGLVHRNVKASNIVLKREADDQGVLTGFGIVEQLRSPLTPLLVQTAALPQADPSVDIQALTVTLYYLLTRQHPATRSVDLASFNQTTLDDSSLVALRQLHPKISAGVEQAILKGLQPAHLRPQSIGEWLENLDHLHPDLIPLEAFQPTHDFAFASVPALTNGHLSLDTLTNTPTDTPTDTPTEAGQMGDRPFTTKPSLPQFEDLAAGLTQVPMAAVPRPILPEPPQPVRQPVRWLPIALVMTAAIATLGGAGFGLALRLDAPSDPNGNTTGFGRDQSFPPIEDWPGADTYDFEPGNDIPVERRPSSGDSTDYGIDNFTPEYDPEYDPTSEPEYAPEPLPIEEDPSLAESDPPLKVEPLPESVESLDPLDIAPLPVEPSPLSPPSSLYPSVNSSPNPNVRSTSPQAAPSALDLPLPEPE